MATNFGFTVFELIIAFNSVNLFCKLSAFVHNIVNSLLLTEFSDMCLFTASCEAVQF